MVFKKIVAANWKMNKTFNEATEFFDELKTVIEDDKNCEVIIFPPFTLLDRVNGECKRLNIKVGAQNCYFEKSGAFTGEVSADMLRDAGAEYVILGHSERRTHFGETDDIINKKLKRALACNLKAVLCVGESRNIRESGSVKEFLIKTLTNDFKDIKTEDFKNIIVAYEPIWAVGSGLTVTFNEADEIGKFIKDFVKDKFGCDVRVLYGGSVNGDNANGFLSLKNIDGALVGGASLIAESFIKIINSVE